MPKKIVCLMASPRKGGNTDVLLQEFINGAKDKNAEITLYYLFDLDIQPCLGCDKCKEQESGLCVIRDDMQQIYPELKEADAVIYGSPMYMGYFTGPMTTFFHRCYCLINSPEALTSLGSGKDLVFVMPYGRDEPHLFDIIAEWMTPRWERIYNGRVQWLMAHGVRDRGEVKNYPEFLKKAYDMGRAIASEKPPEK